MRDLGGFGGLEKANCLEKFFTHLLTQPLVAGKKYPSTFKSNLYL